MCEVTDSKRNLVSNVIKDMTDKRLMFSALDIKHEIANKFSGLISEDIEWHDIGSLVRRAFILGQFPQEYVMKMVNSENGKPFCVYYFSDESMNIDFSTIMR